MHSLPAHRGRGNIWRLLKCGLVWQLRRAFYHRTEMKSVTSWPVYPTTTTTTSSSSSPPLSFCLSTSVLTLRWRAAGVKTPSATELLTPNESCLRAPSMHGGLYFLVWLVRAVLPRCRKDRCGLRCPPAGVRRSQIINESGNIITAPASSEPHRGWLEKKRERKKIPLK